MSWRLYIKISVTVYRISHCKWTNPCFHFIFSILKFVLFYFASKKLFSFLKWQNSYSRSIRLNARTQPVVKNQFPIKRYRKELSSTSENIITIFHFKISGRHYKPFSNFKRNRKLTITIAIQHYQWIKVGESFQTFSSQLWSNGII